MKENIINKKIYKGIVEDVSTAAENMFFIKIKIHDMQVKPGQFVSIYCDNLTLRRPFSVMNYDNNILTILFKLKGKGTNYLKSLKRNDVVDFSGPFGNGFNIKDKKSLLVAAGVGVAPINYLRQALNDKKIENRFICGFLTKNCIPNNIELDMISTDDGSYEKPGSILNYLDEEVRLYKPEKIYACGPAIVLEKISSFAEQLGIDTEICMEKEMACSIGVCRGCVIELKNGKNASVCKDGPVFLGSEIKW